MLDGLPASRAPRLDPRGGTLAALSLLLHLCVAGSIVLASWLAVPPISLPRKRPLLVTHPRAGAPAPKLGGRNTSSLPARRVEPLSSIPRPTEQPRETPAQPLEKPPEPAGADPAGGPAGEGDPDGVPEGDSLGVKGGICLGANCDPEGPVGLGPGLRGAGEVEGGPPILRPGIAEVTSPVLQESSRVLPRYPELARRAGLTGRVILEAVILPDGRVASVTLLRESPPRLGFGEAAIEAVSRWRYSPATQNGRPVAVYFTVTVDFTLAR